MNHKEVWETKPLFAKSVVIEPAAKPASRHP
jgi:hypothetical protein